MRAFHFILASVFALISASQSANNDGNILQVQMVKKGKKPLVGGWSPPNYNQGLGAENGKSKLIANIAIAVKEPQLTLLKSCSHEQQIVAGMNHRLSMIVTDGKMRKMCETTVYEKLPFMEDRYEVTRWQCKDPSSDQDCPLNRRRRSGGIEEINVNDFDVTEAAQWAMAHINQASNSLYMHTLQRVKKVSRQVVNGLRYELTLSTVPTTCRNSPENKGKGLDLCPLSSTLASQDCKAVVVHSLGKYSMDTFTCNQAKSSDHALLGADGHGLPPSALDNHDNQAHAKPQILGGEGHGLPPKMLFGGDDHDKKPHVKPHMLGEEGHGLPPVSLLGGDDHDKEPHTKPHLLGGEGHGLPPKHLLGGDDHDRQSHKKPSLLGVEGHGLPPKYLLGGDDHDKQPHMKPHLLGQEGHGLPPKYLSDNIDNEQSKKHLLGEEGHGLPPRYLEDNAINHPKNIFGGFLIHGQPIQNNPQQGVARMSILGGGDHDYRPHFLSGCQQYAEQFSQFKLEHRRLYASHQEETQRFQVFCENMQKIEKIQSMEQGTAKYGVNQFADMSESEFKQMYLGLRPAMSVQQLPKAEIPKGPVPDSWDWRDHGAVTAVKNQGSCGSCWAFSTTGNVEGQWAIQKKKLLSLSEQELVDCDKVDEGCNGGLPSQAYDAIMKLGGLETEKDYGYKGYDEKCHFNKSDVAVKVTGAVNISQDENEIKAWLYHNGPISIGINAFAMQFYWGGVAHPWKLFCNPKELDHGVLIVGYGEEKGKPYWIVKNSWGPSWGREGYYYVYRGDGTCGLNTMCTSATVV